jgi:simple sugar transport system permease protein
VAAFGVALALIVGIMSSLGKDPALAALRFMQGALGTANGRADVVMAALPMLLCASGLLLTFTAGLWNIGVEGQVTMGAIFATILARSVPAQIDSPLVAALIVPAELALAMAGGGLWAGVAALLRTRGGVNEIFGGVALNFIAVNVLLSLVNGPWRVGSFPQTAPFEPPALLPRVEGLRLSIPAIGIALVAFGCVYLVLRGTRFGLGLRAIGQNERSAYLLGVRTQRNVIIAMMCCGALAGLAGAFQVLFTRGRLLPGVSGGVGFMGVLIVLLVAVRGGFVPAVALFFALVPIGSLRLGSALETQIQIDPALGNVFQSALVLAVLVVGGLRERWRRRHPQHG